MFETFQVVATAVQALSAVAVALLTWKLIQVTRWYAETTDRYAVTAERQFKEAVQAREAAFQPYIHVGDAFLEPTGDWTVEVTLSNLGSGPALNINGCLSTRVVQLDRNSPRTTVLPPGSEETRLALAPFTDDFPWDAEGFLGEAMLAIEYSDILGHWWVSEVPLRIEKRPDLHSRLLIRVLAPQEHAQRIEGPRQHRDAELDTGPHIYSIP